MSVFIIFLLFALLLFISVPIGPTLAFLALLPHLVDSWFPADGPFIIRAMIGGVNSFPILAVPLFILSGNIMAKGKISEKLFRFFAYFVGDRTGGMPITVIITCLFYGAISGSGPATVAAVGSMTIPILVELGYDRVFSTTLVAVAGGLGVIIPPSIPFIFYGQAVGVSVGELFKAGILPGLLVAFCLIVYAYLFCRKNGENKEEIKTYTRALREKGVKAVFLQSFFALLSPIIIIGSIYTGIASPTEAAVISVFYSLLLSMIFYKSIRWHDLPEILISTIKTTSAILFIIAAAIGFARVLTFMQVPELVVSWVGPLASSKIMLLLFFNVLFFFVGMVMDTTPAILILAPILLPLAVNAGLDPVHFGIIMVVNLAMGFVTPPMGVNLFVAGSLTGLPVERIAHRAVPFVLFFIFALLLITYIPAISLFLVK